MKQEHEMTPGVLVSDDMAPGDYKARCAALEAELAELRTKNAGLQKLYRETEAELLDKVQENGLLRKSIAAAPAPVERVGHEAGLYAVKFLDNWGGELNCYWLIARLDDKGEWLSEESGKALLQYEGDKILSAIRLDTPQPAPTSAQDVAGLVEALEIIRDWSAFPKTGKTWDSGQPMSYGACYGSNGERDFMRNVAVQALAAHQSGGAK